MLNYEAGILYNKKKKKKKKKKKDSKFSLIYK